MKYIVCRPLPIGAGVLPSGTEVDTTGWRHVQRLVELRYLRPVDQAPAPRARGREVRDAK